VPVHPRQRTRSSGGLLALPFVFLPPVLIALLLGIRLLLAPTDDVSQALGVPPSVDRFLQRDRLAYPVHAALGTAINRLNVSPAAAGAQWLKAASHARSDDQLARTVAGIAEARARDSEGVPAALCPWVRDGGLNRQARTAIEQSGLPCPP